MDVRIIVDGWLDKDPPFGEVAITDEILDLITGQFHSGTTFVAHLELGPEEEKELKEHLLKGYRLRFYTLPK